LGAIKCKVVCTTHLLEVFSLQLLRNGHSGIRVYQMAVHVPSNKECTLAAPLFKLENGVASSSAGLVCAERAGINKHIVKRAKEIIEAAHFQRQVEPCKDALTPALHLNQGTCDAIQLFLEIDSWRDARDEDIRRILHYVSRM